MTKRDGVRDGGWGGGCASLKSQLVVFVHSKWGRISAKQPSTVFAMNKCKGFMNAFKTIWVLEKLGA